MLSSLPADLMFLKNALKTIYKTPSHELMPESEEIAQIVLRPFQEHLESFDTAERECEYERAKEMLEQWSTNLSPPYPPAEFISGYISLLDYEDLVQSWDTFNEPAAPVERASIPSTDHVPIEFDPPEGFTIARSRDEQTVLYRRGHEEITIYVVPGGRRWATQHNPEAERRRLERNPHSPRFEFHQFASDNVRWSRRRRDTHVDYELTLPDGDVDVALFAKGSVIGGLTDEVEATLPTLRLRG